MMDRLSFLGRSLPPAFERRLVAIDPGTERAFRGAEWRDALVVVECGEVELVCSGGTCRLVTTGDVLWLAGLDVRTLRNRGSDTALLAAVSRRPP